MEHQTACSSMPAPAGRAVEAKHHCVGSKPQQWELMSCIAGQGWHHALAYESQEPQRVGEPQNMCWLRCSMLQQMRHEGR